MVVLCIDNDPEDIEFFCDAVNRLDPTITCLSATTGQGALNLLSSITDHQQLPVYVFLDINMPQMNGKDTLIEIRKNDRFDAIHIVMLSTGLSISDSGEYRKLGANDFMPKATCFQDLCEKLESVFNSSGRSCSFIS